MIYCVVPVELEDELFDKLTRYYEQDANVTVIVEQRRAERRERGAPAPDAQRREIRDRRRRRIAGDLPQLEGE